LRIIGGGGGIISLQYADGTLLFSSCELSYVNYLKVILMLFEKVSDMGINFHKSEIIPMNLGPEQVHEVMHTLNCPVGKLPFGYLGRPIHFEKLTREDLQPLFDKLIKTIAGWRVKMLAYSSIIVLIKTWLASVPVYLLSFLKFPKWAIKLLESQMGHCVWNGSNESHRYHLASWQQVNMRQEFGGLGVPNLRELNLCLLGSWVRRYSLDKDNIWKKLVDYKYNTRNPNIFTCKELGASNFWNGVIWVARVAKMGYRWQVGNGVKIHFWEDVWLWSSSLAIQYWKTYCTIN
jgi:hypothetical protein